MDDRVAQYYILLADACNAARLAGLPVACRLSDGRTVEGVPAAAPAQSEADGLDDTGYAHVIAVGDVEVELASVVQLSLRAPDV